MPLGLKTASVTFEVILLSRMIRKHGLTKICINYYIDDLVVFSKLFDEHLVHIKKP